jgi:hypothetical protein
MNSQAPQRHGTVKLHKPNMPIRPIINWTDSLRYKVAKLINKLLNTTLQLPNAFNIPNTSNLIQLLNIININRNTKFCSFDIVTMYTSIPTMEVKQIIKDIFDCDYHTKQDGKKELLS